MSTPNALWFIFLPQYAYTITNQNMNKNVAHSITIVLFGNNEAFLCLQTSLPMGFVTTLTLLWWLDCGWYALLRSIMLKGLFVHTQ